MLDDDFLKQIEELKKQIKPPPEQEPFGDRAIGEFCVDLADAINGINPSLQKSFNHFYNHIDCIISGDMIDSVTISSTEDCPDLHNLFHRMDFPATINLKFILSGGKTLGWQAISENIRIYFKEYEYEVHYEYAHEQELRYPKPYLSYLYSELDPILETLSKTFLAKIAAKAKNV